ncbi:MAG: glycosyltransferase [Phycisphaerales bacterium]|nr:MAG: glycosyltransferase [Phycisphaerales bacterium]
MPEEDHVPGRRILLLSRLFPKAPDPRLGIFTLRQAERLRHAGFDIEVISPVPFIPQALTHVPRWRRYRNQTAPCEVSGFNVHRPAYFRPPGKWFIGYERQAMWWGIRSTVERLAAARPFDLVYAWDFKVDVGAGCDAARQLGIPCVGLAIGGDLNVDVRWNSKALQAITRSLLECDAIACVSEALRKRVQALTRGRREATVITTGADLTAFRPATTEERVAIRRDLNWPADAVVVLSAGYLLRAKGVFELLAAFDRVAARHPQAMLVYLGDGAERQAMESRIADSPVKERIRLLGHIHHLDVARYFRAADILALPSYHEGMPNVVLEGMGAGLPILATRVGGIPEAVPDERYGILVPPRDENELSQALERMLADKPLRRSMGAAGRQRAVEHYDIERLTQRMGDFLDQSARQGRRQPEPSVPTIAVMTDISSNAPYYMEPLAAALRPHLEVTCRASTFMRQPLWYDECGLREDLMCWVIRLLSSHPRLNTKGTLRNLIRAAGYFTGWLQIITGAMRERARVIHIQWCMIPTLDIFMFVVLRLLGFRLIYTVHDAMPHSDRRWRSRIKYRQLYRLAHALVVLSEQVGRDLQAWVLPGISHKIHQIEHGLLRPKAPCPTRDDARRQLGVLSDQEMLLFFGAISPYKGIDDLIEAAALASRARPGLVLFIAGDPREPFDRYQDLIDRLGVTDRVRSHPQFVDESFKVRLYAAADLVILPHRDPSQSGMGCEALALGKPLVATDRGGLPDLVEPGKTGYLVPAEDPAAMAQAIVAFFSQSCEQQQAMAEASRQLGLQRFDWKVIARKHVDLYRALARA